MNAGDPLKIVYFGTPDFAVPALARLAADRRFAIELVVTQPDRPAGRGRRLTPPPVKTVAEDLGLPIYQPESLRLDNLREPIRAVEAAVFVVAAYGKIFGRKILQMPPLGCINLHASLLPRYRGASPVPAAILCGDEQTGVTMMKMEPGLDTGPTLGSTVVNISRDARTDDLLHQLAHVAADLVADVLPRYALGEIAPHAQVVEGASVVRPLMRADGWLDWSRPAIEVERRVRAMWPWPRGWTTTGDQPMQIHAAHWAPKIREEEPGTVIQIAGECAVACGDGHLLLDVVQPAGSRPMPGSALLAGRRIVVGDRLGVAGAPPAPPPLIEWLDRAGHPLSAGCQP